MQAHYVPKFYLRGFTDPTTPARQEPYVHVYDVAQGRWRRRAPANLACIPDYYAATLPDGSMDQTLEAALARLEGEMADLLRRLVVGRIQLTAKERVRVAEFVAALMLRVPVAQDAIAAQIASEGRQQLEALHAAVQAEPALLDTLRRAVERSRRASDAAPAPSDVPFDPADLNPDDYEVEARRNAVLLRAFQSLEYLVPHVAAMGWGLLRAPTDQTFLTSDAPVYLWCPRGDASNTLADIARPDAQLTLPLTRELALYAAWDVPELSDRMTTAATVEQINIRSAAGATALFASRLEPVGMDRIVAARGR